MVADRYADSLELFKTLYRGEPGDIYVCSLLNVRDKNGSGGERKIITRSWRMIEKHIAKWDRPGRGGYFAVNPVQTGTRHRGKDAVFRLLLFGSTSISKTSTKATTVTMLTNLSTFCGTASTRHRPLSSQAMACTLIGRSTCSRRRLTTR